MNRRILKGVLGALAVLSLCGCLAAPALFFLGRISESGYRSSFLAASIGWFVFAIARGAVGPGRGPGQA